MEKLLILKRSLQQRFDQIIEMQKLNADLQNQKSTIEEQINQINKLN